MRAWLPWTLLAMLACTSPATSALRWRPSWQEALDEGELVVVGHLTAIPTRIQTSASPSHARSGYYRATLAVDEVLKGEADATKIPISIHTGLILSHAYQDGKLVRHRGTETDACLAIWSTDLTAPPRQTVIGDAKQPAVWILAHRQIWEGHVPRTTQRLSVSYAEHIRAIALKPFIRAVLDGDTDRLTRLLSVEDIGLRRELLLYFAQTGEPAAFPAVARLLRDDSLSRHAIAACVACGGEAAIPYLRPLLDDDTGDRFTAAAYAIGRLGDTGAVPRLLEVLESGRYRPARAVSARVLGGLGDLSVMPASLAALKSDEGTHPTGHGPELWQDAQKAIEALTGCRLSPNADKAQRWWEAAKGLPPETWTHFQASQLVASIPSLGLSDQYEADRALRRDFDAESVPQFLDHTLRDPYDPQRGADAWRTWLTSQEWEDYQALPSQIDDELRLVAETVGTVDSGQPVYLRYTVTNMSDGELWITTCWWERADECYASGGWRHDREGEYGRPPRLTRADFLRLAAGESHTFLGRRIAWNDPHFERRDPPVDIHAGVIFDRKGTSLGLDAWVGCVWAPPIRLE